MRTLVLGTLLATLLAGPRARGDEPAPPAAPPRLDDLQREYEKLRESLFTSRARAATVGGTLYSSKLLVHLRFGTPRFFHVSRALVRLDGAAVFDDPSGAVTTDDLVRFDGFVAPGRHLVTVRVDCEAKDDAGFASSTDATFTIDVPQHRQVVLRALAEDGGDIGSTWGKKQRGSYRLHLDAELETKELAAGAAAQAPAGEKRQAASAAEKDDGRR